MDDDQENRPESIPLLLNKLAEGYDLVYATPEKRVHQPWRNFITTVYKRFLAWATGVPTLARMSACCAFRTHLRDAFADTRSPDVFLSLMLSWGTTKIASVYVPFDRRKFGQSSYNFLKLAAVAIGLITGYTTVPLRLASAAGLTVALFGIAAFIIAAVSLIVDHTLRELTFMASLIAVIGGAQLLAIGIIGEYLALMHKHAIDRPAYVVRSRIDGGVMRRD
jgi:undecaprenyl-phosphate 4-deoxy-4-formamido-L-arabinose transferase